MRPLKVFSWILCVLLVAVLLTACGIDDVDEPESNSYANIDLSQYSEYGALTDDGIMWVKKSGYDDVEYGYINSKGEYIIPLSSEITYAHDFRNGFAIAEFDDHWDGTLCKIYNIHGEVVGHFFKNARTTINYLNNGNIYLNEALTEETTKASAAYMFCAKSNKIVEMPIPYFGMWTPDYSDGLMLVFSYYMDGAIKYFDSDGNCVLDLEESCEYSVVYATDFVDGKASITFLGKDGEHYIVDIDKTGRWLSEPVVTYEGKTFWNKYGV